MIHLVIVGEGQAEETFVGKILSLPLARIGVMVQARLIPTSKFGHGGSLKRERVIRYLRNTLRERADTHVTTFFDLYGLTPDFPGVAEAHHLTDPIARAARVEEVFTEAVVAAAECRRDRFLPHIQPYEFEALLFSDLERLVQVESQWRSRLTTLQAVRGRAASPEHINDGPDTHPSAELCRVLVHPTFRKVLHGTRIAEAIGLHKIRIECRHFRAWLERIERLSVLE